ncbi:hypothetical protein JC525_10940 [Alteromonas sp. IB21]|uniref:cytochrome-c peroxidase n=1 Tax=Alteromonas sp. IB21 TaxID=2779369 RepID=UPI0018E7C2DB|nr:cytochrome c peroxidase [Alteromonas sp. IB21]MBJ2129458.1 hypothetical protein [Alteromonas sp. IB21]
MKSIPYIQNVLILTSVITVSGCGADKEPTVEESSLSTQLMTTLNEQLDGGAVGLLLPQSTDFSSIPADPNNTLTEEKVFLGMMLFHETAVATEGVHEQLANTWSCASCHHAAAGFKSGVVQGIGEGGTGFGVAGKMRVLAEGFDKSSTDPSLVPDVQPLTSPSILNTAYQEVMLWNGQFGNQHGGLVNAKLPDEILATPGTPKAENTRGLGGLETQAIAGTKVHRLNTFNNSLVQQNMEYQLLYEAAFPEGGDDILENMGKAIAAYERTVLANRAPFQRWLQGEDAALTDQEKRGALLFFGKAGCASCHTGPALSSKIGAANEEMFMAIGFADLDTSNPTITGVVTENDAKGRGGFTGRTEDNYKFKVPQLYNLKDSNVFGHGGSFTSVKQVVLYKNAGVPQKRLADGVLDDRFVPLNLNGEEIDDLVAFLEEGLYDPNLERYVPGALPSGACFPVADEQSKIDLNCAL